MPTRRPERAEYDFRHRQIRTISAIHSSQSISLQLSLHHKFFSLPSQRADAQEKYQIRIEELMSDERVAEKKQEDEVEQAEQFEIHKTAYVENLNGPYLFESMYKDDAEGLKLKALPGTEEMLAQYPFSIKICVLFLVSLDNLQATSLIPPTNWKQRNYCKAEG